MKKDILKVAYRRVKRNQYGINDLPSKQRMVNIEYYHLLNIGDTLGPVIVDWLLKNRNIEKDTIIRRTKHLMTVGSIISMGYFDSSVWGSGLINANAFNIIYKKKNVYRRKLDIRAVRGPKTREYLIKAGYNCPETFGDPAILMPYIYDCKKEPVYDMSIVLHYKDDISAVTRDNSENKAIKELKEKGLINIIDPKTNNYQMFIQELSRSKKVISSSLHGIILAEAYGIPAVFLGANMDEQLFKFDDWYTSTGRKTLCYNSITDAIEAPAQSIPDLGRMRDNLLNAFPYDLWQV